MSPYTLTDWPDGESTNGVTAKGGTWIGSNEKGKVVKMHRKG